MSVKDTFKKYLEEQKRKKQDSKNYYNVVRSNEKRAYRQAYFEAAKQEARRKAIADARKAYQSKPSFMQRVQAATAYNQPAPRRPVKRRGGMRRVIGTTRYYDPRTRQVINKYRYAPVRKKQARRKSTNQTLSPTGDPFLDSLGYGDVGGKGSDFDVGDPYPYGDL